MSDDPLSGAPTPRVPLGGDYWQVDPGTELWGFADLHAHLMAHLTFGGNAFWGKPYDPDHTGDEAMAHALPSCEPIHGGLIDINPEIGHPAGGGWPDFIIWPRFTTLVHQQAYVDWIYRAYQGGLRLITCLAVNNELLGTRSNPKLPTDDKSAIERQVTAMKQMIVDLDRQAGGPGQSWMQIAYSAEEARAIIKANKLAIVFGVEVDSLGNWRRLEDLQEACGDDLDRARELIGAELDWLHGLGIRQITPIHLTDNAFGGTAVYMRLLDILNIFVTGRHYHVENAWDTGIRYRLDRDGDDVADDARLGRFAGHPDLGAADYKLVHHAGNGRAVYSFCMCPGGTVVAATSEPHRVVTNGMSQYSRNERNANAGIVVGINPEADFPGGPLAGVELQEGLESTAYRPRGRRLLRTRPARG